MKTMWIAFLAIAVIAFGSNLILKNAGFSAQDRASGDAVRLGE